MKIHQTPLEGVLEIHPKIFEDNRGYFFESFRSDVAEANGILEKWIQENQSFSQAGTVRGLHFQRQPYAQAKLVRVVRGKVLDVAVDLRKGSPTYGKSYSKLLDTKDHHMLYVPVGFAHGFSVLEDAVFCYKCSNYYHKESEGGIRWDDPDLEIDWKVDQPILSDKDRIWPTLREFTEQSEGGL